MDIDPANKSIDRLLQLHQDMRHIEYVALPHWWREVVQWAIEELLPRTPVDDITNQERHLLADIDVLKRQVEGMRAVIRNRDEQLEKVVPTIAEALKLASMMAEEARQQRDRADDLRGRLNGAQRL